MDHCSSPASELPGPLHPSLKRERSKREQFTMAHRITGVGTPEADICRENLLFEKKRVFVEGQRARENARIVDKYKKAARSSDGAVLFAVFRGRNAEGSNFPYEEARGIFNVGLPYADFHDPLVRAQIGYFNKKHERLGDTWYIMDAFRAANQAMGRGIRHRDDWCHFYLMDRRYGAHWRFISKWAVESGIEEVSLD